MAKSKMSAYSERFDERCAAGSRDVTGAWKDTAAIVGCGSALGSQSFIRIFMPD